MKKICPITKEICNPNEENEANSNCSFYEKDMFNSRCVLIEAFKSLPVIAEGIRKIKTQV